MVEDRVDMDMTSHHIESNASNVANIEKNDLKVTVIFPAKNEEVPLRIQYQWHQGVVLIQR